MSGRNEFDFDYSETITPDDSNDLTDWGRCVGIHNAGDDGLVNVHYHRTDEDGNPIVDDVYLRQGDYLKAPIKRILSTGTTAGEVHALFVVSPRWAL